RKIIQELEKPTSWDFTHETLEGAVELVQEHHGFNIVIDKAKLKEQSVATNTFDVNVKVNNVSLKSALKLLLDPKKLTYVIENDALKITTNPEGNGKQRLGEKDRKIIQELEELT